MAKAVELPQLGNTVEECLIARWFKHEGDAVVAGEVIAEIETDKTTFEITSSVEGILLERFFEEGALAPVFATLCVIGEAGESVEAFRPGLAVAATMTTEVQPVATDSVPLPTAPTSTRASSPRASRLAARHGLDIASVVGSGPAGRVIERDVRSALLAPDREPSTAAHEPGVGHTRSVGAGSTHLEGVGSTHLEGVGFSPAGASRLESVGISPAGPRTIIARRMRESLASTAQYTLHGSASATGLLALRASMKANGLDITIGDLVAFCTIKALLDTPAVNAEFIDGAIRTHADVHLGFACDTTRGLLVPVVRDAHTLPIADLSARMKHLARLAVDARIAPADLSGATFTISNLGSLGVEAFTPVINPPQVAILGVTAIQLKPVRAHDVVEFVDTIGLSLTCDHQVVDGAPAARFLRVVKQKIETVESLARI